MTAVKQDETKLATLEPRVPVTFNAETMDDTWRQAKLLAPSSLIPKHLRGSSDAQTLANVTLVLAHGRELGLPPTQSLSGIAVVNGKPFVESRTLGALVRASGHCEWLRCTETTSKTCTWETKRRGEPAPDRRTYTWADATQAGNTGKDTYKQHPAKMLSARALGWLLNDVYPDVTKGVGTEAERDDATPTTYATQSGNAGLRARLDLPETPSPALNADTTIGQRVEPTPEQAYAEVETTDEMLAAERKAREGAT